jgi:hypothetical protein
MTSSSASLSLSAYRPRLVAPSLLLLLGACAGAGASNPSITPETYASVQQATRTDPSFRAARIDKCVKDRATEPQAARETMARLLAVDPGKVDQIYCERLVAAVAAGRISYEDYAAIATHRADAATSRRFLEALSATSPEPPSPSLRIAAAGQLDAYARLLRETSRAGEADEMAARAEKLRRAEQEFREAQQAAGEGRSYETSTYLGFAPDQILQQYAAELRSLGRTEEAGQAETLAVRYREDQTRAVDEMVRRRRTP